MDFLRGLAVLGVIAIHITAILITGDTDRISKEAAIFLNQISRFSVPAFLFVSGILAYHSFLNKNYRGFLKSKIPVLIIPYLSWTILGFVIMFPNDVAGFIAVMLTGTGAFNQLYYIPLLFQCFLLMPIIIKMLSSKKMVSMTLALTLLITAAYQWFLINSFNEFLTIYSFIFKTTFLLWVIYFIAGVFVAKNYKLVKNTLLSIPMWKLALVWILSMIAVVFDYSLFVNETNLSLFVWNFRPIIILFSLITICLLLKIGMVKEFKLIRIIYINSFGIYLCHMGILFVMNKIAPFLFSNIAWATVAFVCNLFLSYIFTEFIKRTPLSFLLLGEKSKSFTAREKNN